MLAMHHHRNKKNEYAPSGIYLLSFVVMLVSHLRYLCLFAHSGVQQTLCCVFAVIVFVLCLLYQTLAVSLSCPF